MFTYMITSLIYPYVTCTELSVALEGPVQPKFEPQGAKFAPQKPRMDTMVKLQDQHKSKLRVYSVSSPFKH